MNSSCTGPSADWVTLPSGNNFACFDFNNTLTSNGGFPSAGWQAIINQFGGSQNISSERISILAPSTEVGNIEGLQVFAGSEKTSAGILALYTAAEAFAIGQNLYGANITSRDCNRKNCNDGSATSFATLLLGGIEIDVGVSNPVTQQSRILVLEHGPDSKSQAGSGSSPRDYGMLIANDADILNPTVTCTGTCATNHKMVESAGAGFSGDTSWTYCAKFDANGSPDTWEWTNYCTASGSTGTDLVIGAANTVTSASINPSINGGAAYGFTAGTVGDQIEITAGTGFTVGKYTVTAASSGAATLAPSPGTNGSTGGTYTLWQAQNKTVSQDTLTIQGTTTQVVGTSHTFLSATDADQSVHITSQVTGTCTVGWYHIASVSGGVATLDSATGVAAGTCLYDLVSVHYPASTSATYLMLPVDTTTTVYRQGQKIRGTATSYGVAINQQSTTSNQVGDLFTFTTGGVPNINIGIAGGAGSMDKFMVVPPAQLGPSSIGTPTFWQSIDANAAVLTGVLQWDYQNNGQWLIQTPSTGQVRISTTAGVDKAFYDLSVPAWMNNNYCNFSDCNNAKMALNTTGAQFTRNVADANPVVTIQQVNAGSTGDVIRLANNSQNFFVFSQSGAMTAGSAGSINLASAAATTGFTIPIAAGAAPTANGVMSYDSTQGCTAVGGGTGTGKKGCLQRALATTISGTDTLTAATINTTETAFATTYTAPANFFIAGKSLRVTWTFTETTSAAAVTQRFRIRATDVNGTILWDNGSALAVSNNLATRTAQFSCIFTGTAAVGASVNVLTQCGGAGGSSPTVPWIIANTVSPAQALATNAQIVLVPTMLYGTNTAGNSVTIWSMIVEELN